MRLKWGVVCAAVASVAGCVTAVPPMASPSEYTVIYPWHAGLPALAEVSGADMHDRAEIYCAQYGRLPQETATFDLDGMTYVQYDCVLSTRPLRPDAALPAAAPLVPSQPL